MEARQTKSEEHQKQTDANFEKLIAVIEKLTKKVDNLTEEFAHKNCNLKKELVTHVANMPTFLVYYPPHLVLYI